MGREPVSARRKPKLENQWFAVRVKSRCEKLVTATLTAKRIEVFPALARQRRVWADRARTVELPLFPGYVFAQFDFAAKRCVEDVPGVAAIVSFGRQCCPVPPQEIVAIQTFISSGLHLHVSPGLQVGVPVRVIHGPLRGAEGTLAQICGEYRLVVSLSILHRTVAVEIDQAFVEVRSLPANRFGRLA
jgi:transcription antitermination factor NusG